MKELIGKTIYSVWMDEKKEFIAFFDRDNNSYFYKSGDCAFSHWFEEIYEVDGLFGSKSYPVKIASIEYENKTQIKNNEGYPTDIYNIILKTYWPHESGYAGEHNTIIQWRYEPYDDDHSSDNGYAVDMIEDALEIEFNISTIDEKEVLTIDNTCRKGAKLYRCLNNIYKCYYCYKPAVSTDYDSRKYENRLYGMCDDHSIDKI